MYNTICNIVKEINYLLWGDFTIIFIFSAGLVLTVKLHFIQFRNPTKLLRYALTHSKSGNFCKSSSISLLQSLSTSLGASMGIGNIIGVAVAISTGGAGAVLWMVISSFFVMSFAFAENTLGVKYCKYSNAGAMSYIRDALLSDKAAKLYASACLLVSFGMGNSVQANAAALSLDNFGVSTSVAGIILMLIIGYIIFMGSNFTARICEISVPVLSAAYIFLAFVIMVKYRNNIMLVLTEMVRSAFGISAVTGGISGTIIKQSLTTGLRRGMFSNEAGMGSSVFAHTSSECKDPSVMGIWAIFEVFIDTVLCCTLTALVILCTLTDYRSYNGTEIILRSFETAAGNFGRIFVIISTVIFAFAAILGWYFYGEKCILYLFPNSKIALILYRLLYSFTAFLGSVLKLDLLWELSDTFNALMFFPNLAAILLLSKEASEFSKQIQHNLR